MRNRFMAGVLAAVVVVSAGCAKPRLDGTSDESLKASTERVRKSLPEARRAEFDGALMAIGMNQFGSSMFKPGGAEAAVSGLRNVLQGKTGEEVIAYAAQLRAEFQAKERAQGLADIKELEEKQAKTAAAQQSMKAFEVLWSKFSRKKGFLGDEPAIEISVKNGTSAAVSRAYFRGTLSSPGRAVPWLREDFNYRISGGLEPGETANWTLDPGWGAWKNVEPAKDAVLTLEVIRLDGPDGKPMFDSEGFSDSDQERLAALRKSFK